MKNEKRGTSVLDVILIINIILKGFGLIEWPWRLALWPLWVYAVLILGGVLYALNNTGDTTG